MRPRGRIESSIREEYDSKSRHDKDPIEKNQLSVTIVDRCAPSDGIYGVESLRVESVIFGYELEILRNGESVQESEVIPDLEDAVSRDLVPAFLTGCADQDRNMRRVRWTEDYGTKDVRELRGLQGRRSLSVIGVENSPPDEVSKDGT